MKHKKLISLLGIEITADRLRVVEARTQGGERIAVAREMDVALSLNPFSAEPELMGREIRAHLDAAGIRARACVLCLPADNLLVHRIDLEGVPESDVESLFSLEAERAFPLPPDEMLLAASRGSDAGGKPWGALAAVPAAQLSPLLEALRRAKLRIVSITPAVTALLDAAPDATGAVMLASGGRLQFAVASRRGLALLRTFQLAEDEAALEAAPDGDGSDSLDDLERELRITLQRMPREMRGEIKQIRLFKPERLQREAREIIESELRRVDLSHGSFAVAEDGSIREGTEGQSIPGAARAAIQMLRGERPILEFWRPREGRVHQAIRQLMAKGTLVRLGVAAGAVAALFVLIFAGQILRAAYLEHRWARMKGDVEHLEAIKDSLYARKDWLSARPARLDVLQTLTEAFPETGSVWVRSVAIRESGLVECTGYSRGSGNYLDMLASLKEAPGVSSLQIGQVKGGNPVQFSFQYMWNKESSND